MGTKMIPNITILDFEDDVLEIEAIFETPGILHD